MTALNLATADRSFTVPSSSFSSLSYGDQTLTPSSDPHPVVSFGGGYAIPRDFTGGASDITGTPAQTPAAYHATFIAIAGPGSDSANWIVYGPGFYFSVKETILSAAYVSGEEVVGSLTLDTAHDSGITVYALVHNATNAFVVNSRDWLLGSIASPSAAGSSTTYIDYGVNGDTDTKLVGIWQFDGLEVSQEDAIDTVAAIAGVSPPVSMSGNGNWTVSGSGVAEVEYEPDLPTIPTPPTGGAQTRPTPPTPATPSALRAAGVYPIRHVYETMPAPTLDSGSRPVDWTPSAYGNDEYAYLQIVVEGTDITTYLDTPTPFPVWERGEPFGSHSAVITLPQLTAFHTIPSWAAHGANVSIRLDIIGGSTVSLFEGFVMDLGRREDSGEFELECLGVLFGADLQLRTPSFTTAPQDIGTLIPALLNSASSRRWADMATSVTGIRSSVAGGWEPILTGFVQELLATALKDGEQYTITCDDATPVLETKDTTTIAWTVRTGQRGIDIDLNSDATQAPNVIYGEGINSDGGRWRNAKYPNWKPDDTPAYPFDNPATTIRVGTKDSDTDTGDGVSVWQAKVGQPVTGVFSQSDRRALMRLQRRTGITVDGYLGPQSWAATFDTGANTGSLDGAFIAPLAAAEEVMPRLYGPDGDDLGANPDFDGDAIRVDRYINYGQGVSKSDGIDNAEEVLARDGDPGWFGVVSFELDPATKSRYELREGENGTIQGWHGEDLTVHVAKARYEQSVVTLEVDTKARDYPTLQAMRVRDREAVDPAKVAVQRLLEGKVSTDRASYDAESPAGRIPKHAVFTQLWDVRRIPMGSHGRIVRSEFTTSSPASEFVVAAFGKPLTAADLLSVVGNPLTATPNPWQVNYDELTDDFGFLQAWGTAAQPAGYFPRQFRDADGETSATLTGRLVDDGGWDYASSQSPWIWVATFADAACYVEGRLYGAPEQ